eukprot:m.194844 g.194844  ORF g.194844 m.194844 type:complete len:467 (-) comp25814_c0_seq2:92-1492(-)
MESKPESETPATSVPAEEALPTHSIDTLAFRSLKRSRDMFLSHYGNPVEEFQPSRKAKVDCKTNDQFGPVKHLAQKSGKKPVKTETIETPLLPSSKPSKLAITDGSTGASTTKQSKALAIQYKNDDRKALALRAPSVPKPRWHPHWKLMRVISGHLGWVRAITVEPNNEWFATGSGDRTIKIFDLASGTLKLTLTGHISTVRGLAVSPRHPYLFSCGEDKQIKCWDLEYNKVIRHYHGHLSAVYCMSLHPTLDILCTGGRDSTVRIWDMRTKSQIHCLTGHSNTVGTLVTNASDPQIISGSHDSTIRLWDLAAGKSMCTLTNHKKSIRSLAMHPKEYTFASGAPDNIKQWYLPSGKFIQNLAGHNSLVNTIAVNQDDVLISGGDNGTLHFWDYRTGYNFQHLETIPQPGSLDSESGIYCCTFDKSGSRFLTGEADKSIKVYKEDPESTEETNPVIWRPNLMKKARY